MLLPIPEAAQRGPGGSASEIDDQHHEGNVCGPKYFDEGHFSTS
jgi:hypothetical protein